MAERVSTAERLKVLEEGLTALTKRVEAIEVDLGIAKPPEKPPEVKPPEAEKPPEAVPEEKPAE